MHAAPIDNSSPCEAGDPVSLLTVVLDADFHTMSPLDRVGLVERMKSFVNIAHDLMTLQPVGDQKLFDGAAVMAGPGNAQKPNNNGVFISWQVTTYGLY